MTTPIPDDLKEFIESSNKGPCYVPKNGQHVTIKTNMMGDIELHPCDCGGVFTRTEEYGWITVIDDDLQQRVKNEIKEARGKVPGFERAFTMQSFRYFREST